MHLLVCDEALEIRGVLIEARVPFLVDRHWVPVEVASSVSLAPFVSHKCFSPCADWNQRRILVIRNGGFGDLLLLRPLLSELRRRWQSTHIALCRGAEYADAVDIELVDEQVDYPVTAAEAAMYDGILEFEDAEGFSVAERVEHLADAFAGAAGIKLVDRTISLRLDPVRAKSLAQRFPRENGVARVGVQLSASNIVRSYPLALLKQVVGTLAERRHQVLLFGRPGEALFSAPAGVIDITAVRPFLTFADSMTALASCDVVVVPDSSLCHVAGALGVPAVALFGPFPSRLRTADYLRTIAIDGNAPCAPCFHHTRSGQEFPENGPCKATGRCEALAAITPSEIVQRTEELIAGTEKR
jgi:ADP-heptose:LPS heptosyltransferase